jgi:hypothetical protein
VESPYSNTAGSAVTHLFVIADNQTVVYGSPNPTPTFKIYGDIAGSLNTLQVTCTLPGVPRNIGSYPITCTGPLTTSTTDGVTYNAGYLTYKPGTLTITTTALAGGVQNQAYSANLVASGGTPPLTWSLANQTTLPAGLSLSNGGQITGTPTGSGTTTFTVQAADSATTPQVATAVLSIAIAPNACPCTISGTISGPGGAQAQLTLSGTAAATTTADSAGAYSFKSLANGSYLSL